MSKSKSKIIACIPSPTGKGKKLQGIVTKFELQNQEVVAQFAPFNQRNPGDFQIIKFNLLIFPNHKLKQAAEEEKKKLLTKQES